MGAVTKRFRAVLDTNVFVSAFLSRNPASPTQELIQRWKADEFTLLVCDALVDEIAGKLLERGIGEEQVIEFLALVTRLAEWVNLPPGMIEPVVVDPDDDAILACALEGKADFLVTYDPHLLSLGSNYQEVKISQALPFLRAVRGDPPRTMKP